MLSLAPLPPSDAGGQDPFAFGPNQSGEDPSGARPLGGGGGGLLDDSSAPAVIPPSKPITAQESDDEVSVVVPPSEVDSEVAIVRRPAASGRIRTPRVESSSHSSRKDKDPFLGRTLGGYVMAELIGHGGMGMVYRGEQVSLGREVAVKVLNKALVDNEEFLTRFRREARAMASIHHSNIVAVIDFGEHEGVAYMVAEFVRGTNLAKMIRDKLMVPPEEVVPIIIQCLSALDHVSQTGIVHRDIKPDNILIDTVGTAKVADFGLAKDLNTDDTDLTAVGSAMGTPAYMSPEQCMGRKLDGRSDIYALGVTAYFALTGEKPFVGNSSFEVMTKQREYTPPPPIQLNPTVPQSISDLVMKMIEKNVDDRFANAEDCRASWLAEGQQLGYIGPVTRSGEFYVGGLKSDGPAPGISTTGDEMPPAPAPRAPTPNPSLRFPSDPQVPSPEPPMPGNGLPPGPNLPPMPPPEGGPESAGSERLTAADAQAPETGGDRAASTRDRQRPITDGPNDRTVGSEARRRKNRTSSIAGAIQCSRCGHLNRGDRLACEHCGAALSNETVASDDDAAGAEKAMRAGRFRDAERIYGRLAEAASDRRQRSLIRAKEREARARADDQQYDSLAKRSQMLLEQGDQAAAIRVLEEASSKNASAELSGRIMADLQSLQRSRRSRRRRIVLMIIVLVLAGLAVTAWALRAQLAPYLPPAVQEALGVVPATESAEIAAPGAPAPTADPDATTSPPTSTEP